MRYLPALLTLLWTSGLATGAAPPGVVTGTIHHAGVSGGAVIRGNRLLLVSEPTNGVLLLEDPVTRLRAGQLEPAAGESLEPLLKDLVDLDDLEEAAWDGARDVYAITSHTRTARGDSPEGRYRLARLRFDTTGKLLEARQSDALLQAIVNDVPFLADSIRRTPARTGLNLEGLAWDPAGELLIGLRSPTITESAPRASGGQEDAVVLRLKNPDAVFSQPRQPARLGDVVKLDLHGQGIRGMAYDPALKAFWIVSGLSAEPNHPVRSPWSLWLWKGAQSPRRVEVPPGAGLEQPETVAPIEVEGRPYLLLVDPGTPGSRFALFPTPELPN